MGRRTQRGACTEHSFTDEGLGSFLNRKRVRTHPACWAFQNYLRRGFCFKVGLSLGDRPWPARSWINRVIARKWAFRALSLTMFRFSGAEVVREAALRGQGPILSDSAGTSRIGFATNTSAEQTRRVVKARASIAHFRTKFRFINLRAGHGWPIIGILRGPSRAIPSDAPNFYFSHPAPQPICVDAIRTDLLPLWPNVPRVRPDLGDLWTNSA